MTNNMKEISLRGFNRQTDIDFIEQLFEAFEQGYRPLAKDEMVYETTPFIRNNIRRVYLKEKEVSSETFKETPEQVLKGLSKKEDILAFASDNNITLEDVPKTASALKKLVQSKL